MCTAADGASGSSRLYQASAKLAEAAHAISGSPGALQLRLLQTVTDVASDRTSTLIMPFPIDLLRIFENVPRTDAVPAASAALRSTVDGPATNGGDAAGRVPAHLGAGAADRR